MSLRKSVLLLGLLTLTACAPPPPAAVQPIPLRNPTAPVASQSNLPLAEILGQWTIIEQVKAPFGPRLALTATDVTSCDPEGCDVTPFTYDDQGRFSTPQGPIWVFWADIGRRTLALGDPNGGFVLIMNRDPQGLTARRTAARDILTWYGFDVSQLNPVSSLPEGIVP